MQQTNELPFAPFRTVFELTLEEYNTLCMLSREEQLEKLNYLKLQIKKLAGRECVDNGDELVYEMCTLAHLRMPEVYLLFLDVAELPEEVCEEQLGDSFLYEDLPHLLSLTAHGRWDEIRNRIERAKSSETITKLLSAVEHMVQNGAFSREPVIIFIRDYLRKAFYDDTIDKELLTHWVCVATALWPAECLEEIKELFAMSRIDTSWITIDCVLKSYQKGFVKKKSEDFLVVKGSERDLRVKENEKKLSALLSQKSKRISDQHLLAKIDVVPQRNQLCPCSSGKKFKQCCLGKRKEDYRVESFSITGDSLDTYVCEKKDEDLQRFLYENMRDYPSKCIEPLFRQIEKYPDYPILYNYLYSCYALMHRRREAHEVLLKTVKLFPNYLFGLVELANYYIRRGEYDEAFKMLKGAHTLKQLYPEREVFHYSEAMSFNYTLGVYYVKKGLVKQAKICLNILKGLDEEHELTEALEKDLVTYLRLQTYLA